MRLCGGVTLPRISFALMLIVVVDSKASNLILKNRTNGKILQNLICKGCVFGDDLNWIMDTQYPKNIDIRRRLIFNIGLDANNNFVWIRHVLH